MQHCVWCDTERDPLAWLRLCWRERTLHPRGAHKFFPYHGHGHWRPVLRAFMRIGQARQERLAAQLSELQVLGRVLRKAD